MCTYLNQNETDFDVGGKMRGVEKYDGQRRQEKILKHTIPARARIKNRFVIIENLFDRTRVPPSDLNI